MTCEKPRSYTEWAVRLDDSGKDVVCEFEAEARALAKRRGGMLMSREVFETTWLTPSQDDGVKP